jgi:hypothetical protein
MNINDYLNSQLSVPRTLQERREMKNLELIRRSAYDTYKADMDLINNAYFNEDKIDKTTYEKLKANAANQYLQHTLPTIRETSFGTSTVLNNVYKNAPDLGKWINAQAIAYNTTPQVIVSVMDSPEFEDVFGTQHLAWRSENLVKANPDNNFFTKWASNALYESPYNKYEKVDTTKIKPSNLSMDDMLEATKNRTTLKAKAKGLLGAGITTALIGKDIFNPALSAEEKVGRTIYNGLMMTPYGDYQDVGLPLAETVDYEKQLRQPTEFASLSPQDQAHIQGLVPNMNIQTEYKTTPMDIIQQRVNEYKQAIPLGVDMVQDYYNLQQPSLRPWSDEEFDYLLRKNNIIQ